MNLLQIIGSMDPATGGTCQGIRNLYGSFKALNINMEVVSMDHPAESFIHQDPFIIHALGPVKSAWQYSPKLLPWLVEHINQFDIIIVNGLWLYHVHAAVKALQLLHKKNSHNKIPKLFLMPHGMLDPYFQKDGDRKIKALRNLIYWKLLESRNIKKAYGLLFTCETEKELARKTFKSYYPQREINVGFGVEDVPVFESNMKTAFAEKCPGLNESSFLLYLSRIHPKKGAAMVVSSYIQLFNSYKKKNQIEKIPKLVIAGPGLETEYGKKIRELIALTPEVVPFIFFTGMISGNAKWGALHGCDAFILPSHQENFGIAVVEALACGKPVLISNQINIWDEIIRDNAGIAEEDNLEGTTRLLECWMNFSSKQKMSMNDNARQCFEKNFSVHPVAQRFVKAFNTN